MGLRVGERICGERSGTMTCRLFTGIFSVSFFVSLSDGTHTSFTGMEEPIFGHPPKVDEYAQVKQQKKYIS